VDERLEGGFVNFFSFVDVDRAAYVSVETRVEETGRILQRRSLREGKLHDVLIGFAGADDAVVRPRWSAWVRGLHPLQLFDDVRVCFLDERAYTAEGFPAPVADVGDSLTHVCLFHVLILACRRCQEKYESAQSTPVPAAKLQASGPSPTAKWAMSAETMVKAKPA